MRALRDLFKKLPGDGRLRHVLRNFNLRMVGNGPIPSVKVLAETLGLDVYEVDLPRHVRGRLQQDPFAEAGYRIEVNMHDNVVVRRTTVLHELMHFFLHPKDDVFATQYRAGRDHFYLSDELAEEREANEALMVLLFGDGALEAAIGLYGQDREKLAKHFGAPTTLVDRALQTFGLNKG